MLLGGKRCGRLPREAPMRGGELRLVRPLVARSLVADACERMCPEDAEPDVRQERPLRVALHCAWSLVAVEAEKRREVAQGCPAHPRSPECDEQGNHSEQHRLTLRETPLAPRGQDDGAEREPDSD